MTPNQARRRQVARDIISHIMVHGHLENQGITDNSLPIASVLERAGVLMMDELKMRFLIADKKKAAFLLHG
jgi:hypothetical protein